MRHLLLLILLITVNSDKVQEKFRNVIVLCMENHSYDNLLGWMPSPIGDLNEQDFFNYVNPNDTTSKKYNVRKGANYQTIPDPPHSFSAVNRELYGLSLYPVGNKTEADNAGFAYVYQEEGKGDPQHIFDCFTPDQVPVISKLASEFKIMNRWFASVPSCTDPNKMFFHAATSQGNTAQCKELYCEGFPMNVTTIYENVLKEKLTTRIHYMDWNEAFAISPLNQNKTMYLHDNDFNVFFDQLHEGYLENYTFLIPRAYESTFQFHANTQHPSQDIRNGEELIKKVYESFRSSRYWNDTLLLITYDEHGGFYDHVHPPRNVPNPSPEYPGYPNQFNFTRLGPRVPAIAISPWLKKGLDSTQFEHSSVPATSDYLTPRDANANHFVTDNDILDEMRTDCPDILPVVPSFESEPAKQVPNELYNGTPESQVYILGTLLVHEKIMTPKEFELIVQKIKNDQIAAKFCYWATEKLGFRQKDQHTEQFIEILQ